MKQFNFKKSQGKFFLGKTSSTGLPIAIRGTSSLIDLPNIGFYEINFYILMFTNITDMTLGGDYIQVSIKSGLDSRRTIKTEKFDYTNIGRKNVWEKKSFKFNSTEKKILVLSLTKI